MKGARTLKVCKHELGQSGIVGHIVKHDIVQPCAWFNYQQATYEGSEIVMRWCPNNWSRCCSLSSLKPLNKIQRKTNNNGVEIVNIWQDKSEQTRAFTAPVVRRFQMQFIHLSAKYATLQTIMTCWYSKRVLSRAWVTVLHLHGKLESVSTATCNLWHIADYALFR